MKVGLFFGSFNPIHTGHLIIAGIMVETTDIDKVWFVVSPQNHLKRRKSLLHEFERLEMVRAAIYDNYNLEVSDVEFRMPKPSYTIDTMTYLAEKHPDKRFVLIIGEDNLKTFPKWKNHNIIIENFEVYVYPRPKSVDSDLKTHPKVRMVEAPMIDISATFIRKCIKQNRSVKYLVPDSVEAMIRSKKFYQN